MSTRFDSIRQQLESVGQSHVLHFYDTLSAGDQARLLDQIEMIDLDQVPNWVERYVSEAPIFELPTRIEPPNWYARDPEQSQPPYDVDRYRSIGEDLIRSGKVAAFCVAGGQGTRLGWDGPKGTYPAGCVTGKALFQMFAEYIRAVQQRYGCVVPFYIMTSPLNHADTVTFFNENASFGLDPEHVSFFPQGTLPSFELANGRIMLAAPERVAVNPDGHGGSLKALYASGALADMKQRGIEHISYVQVDNPLVKVIDPLFLGLHAAAPDSSGQMSSKMLPKTGPFEKMGNFCRVDDRTTIIEYSDLPDELAEKTDGNGNLLFGAGSLAIHALSVDFVDQLNNAPGGFGLPLHRAVKKVQHIDLVDEEATQPATSDGVKLEMFVFDALPLCESSIIYETDRIEEFAPIKNLEGVDSAQSSKQIQTERNARWLESVGVEVARNVETGEVDATIEISPITALEPSDLMGVPSLPTKVEAGMILAL